MPKFCQLYLVSLLLISEVSNATGVCFQIEGLSGVLKKNVKNHLSSMDKDEVTQFQNRQFYMNADNMIRKGLKALGYYEPTIDFDLRRLPRKRRQVLIARVSPGKPVVIGGTKVVLRAQARTDQDYLDLLTTRPKVGSILNHGDYEYFKAKLANIAMQKGYFDSQFIKSQLGIAVNQRQAFWDIDYDSGERYRFGDVTFKGIQIRDKYLQALIPFKKGDYYQLSDLAELNRRLSATGWFNSVVVTPEFDKASQTKILPLVGMVSPSPANTIEAGGGYSTDIGPRIQVIWKKPWINSQGHSLTNNLNLSIPEQKLDFRYKVPLITNPTEQYYLFQTSLKCTNLNDTTQYSRTFNISYCGYISKGWRGTVNLRLNLHHFTQANVTNTNILLYPSVKISRTRSRGGLMPMWGDSQRYSINYSNSVWGSDANFSVVQAQNVWIRTFYNKHRFLLASNLGWIGSDNFDRVPPDLRFFAGGEGSIRGYKYKSISPESTGKGQLTGASKLITGSMEYQYNIKDKWWSAMFVDSGEAVKKTLKTNFKTGAGIGLRWQSPVGAIKVDCARSISDKVSPNIQFYIGVGPEL